MQDPAVNLPVCTAGWIPGSEDDARDFLFRAGVLRVPSRCPSCSGDGIRPVRRNQYRCRRCKSEWSIRRGSILDGLRISFSTFLLLARSFADNRSANDAARCHNLSYNTVYEVYHRLRSAILATEEPRTLMTESAIQEQNPPDARHQVVLGIQLTGGRIVVTEVDSPSSAIITSLPVPTMQRGNILFIDAYGKQYQGFITFAPDRNGRELLRIKANGGMSWSPLREFWDMAAGIWSAHKGLARDQIPSFVREVAFRYNNRDTDIFPVLLDRIALAYP